MNEILENDELIELDLQAGIMSFNFPEKLTTLIQVQEELKSFGFDKQISKKVKEYAQEKMKIYNEAVKLKKVTRFYNSLDQLDSKLLRCQKPLLVDRVVQLEKLMKNMDADLETKPEKLRAFIKKVEGVIDNFEDLNSNLKSIHNGIISDFASLYQKDLVTG